MDIRAMILLILGVLSAIFILLIHDKIILDPGTFSYLIAITRIPAFFLFAGTVLAPLFVGPYLNQVFIFINMVPENATAEFAENVRAFANKYSVPTSNIGFEITERKAIEDFMQFVLP